MKIYKSILLLLLLPAALLYSQDRQAGVFLSPEDFRKKIVTHASGHTRMKLHEVFKKEILEVRTKDSAYVYKKSNLYGFRDNDGLSYRLYQNKAYQIINPDEEILIYQISEGAVLKGNVKTYCYYFSKDAAGPLIDLTLASLERAFSDDRLFDALIEIHYKSDHELLAYDNVHGMYKLNRLLQLAKEGE